MCVCIPSFSAGLFGICWVVFSVCRFLGVQGVLNQTMGGGRRPPTGSREPDAIDAWAQAPMASLPAGDARRRSAAEAGDRRLSAADVQVCGRPAGRWRRVAGELLGLRPAAWEGLPYVWMANKHQTQKLPTAVKSLDIPQLLRSTVNAPRRVRSSLRLVKAPDVCPELYRLERDLERSRSGTPDATELSTISKKLLTTPWSFDTLVSRWLTSAIESLQPLENPSNDYNAIPTHDLP